MEPGSNFGGTNYVANAGSGTLNFGSLNKADGVFFITSKIDFRKLTDEKSPAGKVDYHNMGAMYEVLAALDR